MSTSTSLAEFLVLHHVYERSAMYPWIEGSEFVAEFVEVCIVVVAVVLPRSGDKHDEYV